MLTEPDFTCPLIDKAIDTIRKMRDIFESIEGKTEDEQILSECVDGIGFVEDLIKGRHSQLEKIREANIDIRAWGRDVEDNYIALQEDYAELEAELASKSNDTDV